MRASPPLLGGLNIENAPRRTTATGNDDRIAREMFAQCERDPMQQRVFYGRRMICIELARRDL
jgi:hypothetical protein